MHARAAAQTNDVTNWLLKSDPAVAWQVERDLLGASPDVVENTRARIPNEGFGHRLLSLQARNATWADTLYQPKWTSTFYTLRLLYWFGLDGTHPPAVEACAVLLDHGFRSDGAVTLWTSDWSDTCVTAMTVAMAVTFGHQCDERVDAMVDWLLNDQRDDGGWNCGSQRGHCRVSSFHSTLSVLEAFVDYAGTTDERALRVDAALKRGHAYFRRHQVFLSERTGDVVKDSFTRFSFPPRWYFDVLRALDHFRNAGLPCDASFRRAVSLVESRRKPDGRWTNQNFHTGLEHFRIERPGQPSPFNTLRALRVLRWADNDGASSRTATFR